MCLPHRLHQVREEPHVITLHLTVMDSPPTHHRLSIFLKIERKNTTKHNISINQSPMHVSFIVSCAKIILNPEGARTGHVMETPLLFTKHLLSICASQRTRHLLCLCQVGQTEANVKPMGLCSRHKTQAGAFRQTRSCR